MAETNFLKITDDVECGFSSRLLFFFLNCPRIAADLRLSSTVHISS